MPPRDVLWLLRPHTRHPLEEAQLPYLSRNAVLHSLQSMAFTRILPCVMRTLVSCVLHAGLLYPWCVVIMPVYNVHSYFPLKSLGKYMRIIHGKIQ